MPIPGLRVVAVEDGHADWIRLGPDQDPETSHQHTRVDMLHIGDHIRTAATIYQCNRRAHTWRCKWRDVTVRQRRNRSQHRGEDRELGMRVASGLHPHSFVAELTGDLRPPTAARHRQRFAGHRRVARSGRVTRYRSGHRKSVVYPWRWRRRHPWVCRRRQWPVCRSRCCQRSRRKLRRPC